MQNCILFSQVVNFEKAFLRDEINTSIQISVNGIKLDSINRIELKNKAILSLKNSSNLYSDNFLTDLYFDNLDNKYTIVYNLKENNIDDLKSIRGTFKYFTPSISKNSINLLNITNSSFEKLIFEDSNSKIKIIYLDAFKIDSLRNNKRYFKKIVRNNNLDKTIFQDAIDNHLGQRDNFKIPKNLQNNVIFYIESPIYKVVSNKVQKSEKYNSPEVVSEHHSDKWTIWELRYFNQSIPKDYTIEIISENEDSISEFDFNINCVKNN